MSTDASSSDSEFVADIGGNMVSSPAQSMPVLDENAAIHILSKYFRSKGAIESNQMPTFSEFHFEKDREAADTSLSDIYVMKITCRLPIDDDFEEHKLDLIVKQLPSDPFARFFVKEAQFDIRETKFYTKIIPDMVEFIKKFVESAEEAESQLPVPKCYYPTVSEIEKDDSPTLLDDTILVLEDLKSHDYYNGHFINGLDVEEAILAMESIACIHATSLALKVAQNVTDLTKLYPFLFQTDKATDSYLMLLERGLPQLTSFLEHYSIMSNILNQIMDIKQRTKEIISALLSPTNCPVALLTHTDFWCNNLLFTTNRAHCVILDWQMVTYSKPTNDLALLIISSLSPETRRTHTKLLLDKYWQCFVSSAKKLRTDVECQLKYTRENLQTDYKKSQLLAILLCIGSVDVALGNDQTERRLIEALKDLDNDKIFTKEFVDEYLNET